MKTYRVLLYFNPAFRQPSPPTSSNITDTTVTLQSVIDFETQKNKCEVNRVEYDCDNGTKSIIYPGDRLTYQVKNLRPYTTYECAVRVKNSNEAFGGETAFSDYSSWTKFQTKGGKN